MVARVTRLVAEKFVLSTFPRALTTLSSMCSRAVRALESSPGLIMMMDRGQVELFGSWQQTSSNGAKQVIKMQFEVISGLIEPLLRLIAQLMGRRRRVQKHKRT